MFFSVGTSFAIIPVAEGAFAQMYENGMVCQPIFNILTLELMDAR